MRNSITHIEILEEEGLKPINGKDENAINRYLNDKIEIWYDEDLKVWSDSGIYFADLKQV